MSDRTVHVDLRVVGAREGSTQPVEVEPLAADRYRILHSPGFVEGVAAGDTIRVTDRQRGHFEVLSRGGNVAIKFATKYPIRQAAAAISDELARIGGRFDGAMGRAAVWTVPVAIGFPAIESVMAQAVAANPGAVWWYGNVYDDAGNPLDWWKEGDPAAIK